MTPGLDPSRAPWFMDASPGLLTSKLVRTHLSQYSQQLWPLVVKLTLLHGIQSIQQQFQGSCLSVQQLQQLVESGACGLAVQKTIPALQRQILSLQQELDTVFDALDGEAGPSAATAAAGAAPARPARHTWQSAQPPAAAVYATPVPPPTGPDNSSSSGGGAVTATTPAGLPLLERLQQLQRVPVPPGPHARGGGAGKQRAPPRRRSSSPILAPKPSGHWRAGEATGFPSPPRARGSPLRRSLDNQGATNPIYPDWWGDPTPRPEPPAPPPPQQRPPPRLAYTYRPTAKAPSVLQDDLVTAEYLVVPGSGYGQVNEPLVPGDGPALTTLTLLPQAPHQALGGAAANQAGAQAAAAAGGGAEWGRGATLGRPRKVVRYSDQSDTQQQQQQQQQLVAEEEGARASSAGDAQNLGWTQQQQQTSQPAPPAPEEGAPAAGSGRQPLRRTSSSQKGRGLRLWAVESKIKADVAASKQQAAARRAARQKAFQEAMASSLTFPQLRSSVEQPPLGAASSSGGGGLAATMSTPGAAGGGGGSSASAAGPVGIAERFLSNPLSAWFMGEGPPPGAAPGVTTHHELMWQPEVAWGTPGGAGPAGDMLGPGSDVSEAEVADRGEAVGALRDITSATLNPYSSSAAASLGGPDPASKPPGAAASSSNAAWATTMQPQLSGSSRGPGQQENEEASQTWLGDTAAAAAGGRGHPRRRWDEAHMTPAGGRVPVPPPGNAPFPQQQQLQVQQRRPAWAADYGHLDTPLVLEEVAEQQQEATEAQEHHHKGGVWVGDFGHLEGPRFSRETAFKLGHAAPAAASPAAAGGSRRPPASTTLPAGSGAGAGPSSGLFLSHSELQELVTGALQQAADVAEAEDGRPLASTTGVGVGGRGASATSTPQSGRQQSPASGRGQQPAEEEEGYESAEAEVDVGAGSRGEQQPFRHTQRDRTASWAAQLGGEEEQQQEDEEQDGESSHDEPAGEEDVEEAGEEAAAADAAQLAAVQAQLDRLLARLQPTAAAAAAVAVAPGEVGPAAAPAGSSRPVDAEQLQQRLAEAAAAQLQAVSPASSRSSAPRGVGRGGGRQRPSPRQRLHQQQQQQQQGGQTQPRPPPAAAGEMTRQGPGLMRQGTSGSSVRGSGSIDTALLQMVSEELVAAGWRPEEAAEAGAPASE